MNLFAQAKEVAAPKTAKKTHEEVTINEAEFHQETVRLVALTKRLDRLDAEYKLVQASVKARAQKEYLDIFKNKGKFPETLVFRGTGFKKVNPTQFMFMLQDRYIKIDQERAEQLKKDYGKEIVEETTTYTMDTELVGKYGKVISDLILNSKAISDDDKLKLIKATTEYAVAKGTIQGALKFKKELTEVVGDVKPVAMMRNVKIEEVA